MLMGRPGPMVPAQFTVRESRQDTSDTWTVWLEPNSGEPFAFEPGSSRCSPRAVPARFRFRSAVTPISPRN